MRVCQTSKFLSSKNNVIKKLVENSFKSIDEELYNINNLNFTHDAFSLKRKIIEYKQKQQIPIITEIKFSSPSRGVIMNRKSGDNTDLLDISKEMELGGAAGLSVLTQKYLFNGSIDNFVIIRRNTTIPMLMKDIIVSEIQLNCAKNIGADYVLLMLNIFERNLAEGDLHKFTEYAHKKGLNILYEVHDENEFKEILKFNIGKNDLIGINNRDLDNLEINIQTTEKLLKKLDKGKNFIVSESGISTSNQIKQLRNAGADAFLIGTSIMEKSGYISKKVKELVNTPV